MSPGSTVPRGFPDLSPVMGDFLFPEGTLFMYVVLEMTTDAFTPSIHMKYLQLEKRLRLALHRLQEKGYNIVSVTEVRNSPSEVVL